MSGMTGLQKNIGDRLRRLDASDITKIILSIVLILFLAAVYHRSGAPDVPMDSVESALRKGTDLSSMQKCSNRQLMQFMGLDYSDYDSYIYYKSREALGVQEVLIVRVYRRDDLTAVEDAIDRRVADQTRTFEGYGPSQVAMLKNAIIYKRGNYIFYCVDKNPDRYEEVFRHAL